MKPFEYPERSTLEGEGPYTTVRPDFTVNIERTTPVIDAISLTCRSSIIGLPLSASLP
jgi:hypothetical protein